MNIKLFDKCDFNELHYFNYFEKIIYPIWSEIEWFKTGGSKVTIKCIALNNYVFKIAFNLKVDIEKKIIRPYQSNACLKEQEYYKNIIIPNHYESFFLPNYNTNNKNIFYQKQIITLSELRNFNFEGYSEEYIKNIENILIKSLIKKSFIVGTNKVDPIILYWSVKLSSFLDFNKFITVCGNKYNILDLTQGNLGFDENNIPVITDYSL